MLRLVTERVPDRVREGVAGWRIKIDIPYWMAQ